MYKLPILGTLATAPPARFQPWPDGADLDLGRLADGVATGGLLLLAIVLSLLAWQGRDRSLRWILAWLGGVALALAFSNGLAAMGRPWPALKLLAGLAGSAGLFRLLFRLPRWFAVRPGHDRATLLAEKNDAQARLQATEKHLGILVEEVREYAIFQLDGAGRVGSWNMGAERLTGWRSEEVLGLSSAVFYPEDAVQAGLPEQDLELARRTGSVHQEAWRRRKDGSRFMANEALTALHDGGGLVTGFNRVTHDITERWEAQARLEAMARDLEAQMQARTVALQESEARLQGFIQHAPAAIAFKGTDGQVLLLNRRAESLIGRSLIATPGTNLEALFPPEQVAKSRAQDERVLARKEGVQFEDSLLLPELGLRDFLIQKFPLLDATGGCWGLGVIATDVTERKHQELAQRQRQKLESLGLLAGGIAHDFNNLLGAMLGNLELARMDLCPEPGFALVVEPNVSAAAHLQILEELVTRAATLVAQILAYSGKGKFQIQVLDLNLQVEEMSRILRASLTRRSTLSLETTPDLPPMEGDPGQVNQVIMNLILNASEAMEPHGGVITIRTGLATLTPEEIDQQFPGQALQPGDHLLLEVSDLGPGIAPEVQDRIFEPFFTTKFTGRGLGLSAVHGILRSHQGGVQVLSEAGRGTTFRVLLPASASTRIAKTAAAGSTRHPAEFRGMGTVLVVDDEPPLRAVTVAALRRLGFGILEAGDGLEALRVFEANRDGIVLVLMDLTMPRMDGEDAYHHLRRAGAIVPVILSSGFGQEEAFSRFRGKGLAGFLPKPYRFQTLVDILSRALGPGRPAQGPQPGRDPLTLLPECVTGHPTLDAQHAGLVDAFNQLLALAETGGASPAVAEALTRFIDLTVAHFSLQEALMTATGDPTLREQQLVHAQLTRVLQELAGRLSRAESPLGPPVFDFLGDWLLSQIQEEDLVLVSRLAAAGRRCD
jgi:hemerythrin-like metal-binding protein/PAS domain S-box-containing protein